MTTFANGIPILSLPGTISTTPTNYGSTLSWNGFQRYYQWSLTLTITEQKTSGINTRQKLQYNGLDVNVGMWVANVSSGLAWQIVSITSKSSTSVTCIVQDIFRYNTYRDPTQSGNAGEPVTGSYIIFELAVDGTPMVDPAPTSIGITFFTTLTARFVYDSQEQYDFPLNQPGDVSVSFNPGDILAINPLNQTFVEANETYALTIVGQVTAVDDTGFTFAINPIGKVIDNFTYLPGTVGQFLYAGTSTAGQLSLTPGGGQVYLIVRQWTASTTTSSTFGSTTSVITTPGNTFNVNGILATVGGTGTLIDVENAINAIESSTGVSAIVSGSFYLQITAVDARAINFLDVSGSTVSTDVGLISTQNGTPGAVIVVTNSAGAGGVSSITAGTGISVNQSTGNVVITNTLAPAEGFTTTYGFVFVQPTPSTSWTITHSANTTNIAVQIYDSYSDTNAAGNVIFPDEITIVDVNNIQVTFADAQSGTALLTVFG